jgi:glucose-6-phosphate-specific signal transduction histidine kinase
VDASHAGLITDLETALDSVEGDTADEIVRDAMRRAVKAIQDNASVIERAARDMQMNSDALLSSLSTRLLPKALALLARLKDTGQLRPVADMILARTMVAMLIGFIATEQTVPRVTRIVMRQRAWLDGMVDLLLYGVLEDDAR